MTADHSEWDDPDSLGDDGESDGTAVGMVLAALVDVAFAVWFVATGSPWLAVAALGLVAVLATVARLSDDG